jgi:subtilisin family serine protease
VLDGLTAAAAAAAAAVPAPQAAAAQRKQISMLLWHSSQTAFLVPPLHGQICACVRSGCRATLALVNALTLNDVLTDTPGSLFHTAAAAAAAAGATDLSNIISVGSIASDGALSYSTNYGANSVDLFAPGSNILSTWPVDSYTFLDGTSMVNIVLQLV